MFSSWPQKWEVLLKLFFLSVDKVVLSCLNSDYVATGALKVQLGVLTSEWNYRLYLQQASSFKVLLWGNCGLCPFVHSFLLPAFFVYEVSFTSSGDGLSLETFGTSR